jgi:hypothetical protein
MIKALEERTSFNRQAAGPTAQLTRVRYPGRSARHASFTSAKWCLKHDGVASTDWRRVLPVLASCWLRLCSTS